MKFLYLVFAVLLLFSLAAPGYGQKKHCYGRCSPKCYKNEVPTSSHACKKGSWCCVILTKGKRVRRVPDVDKVKTPPPRR